MFGHFAKACLSSIDRSECREVISSKNATGTSNAYCTNERRNGRTGMFLELLNAHNEGKRRLY